MKTATMAIGSPTTGPARPRDRLEELVDRLMATLTFRVEPEPAPVAASTDLVREIHQARRHRQEGNLDGALETLAGAVPTSASPRLAQWAFTEWKHLVKAHWPPWSTARKRAVPLPWFPQALSGPLRWSPCWACPGARVSLYPGAP